MHCLLDDEEHVEKYTMLQTFSIPKLHCMAEYCQTKSKSRLVVIIKHSSLFIITFK